MDISSIINDIASKLSGTNALIQIQVNDKYYTKKVGDINLLADNPEHLAVRDNRSFPEWMQQQIPAVNSTLPECSIINNPIIQKNYGEWSRIGSIW